MKLQQFEADDEVTYTVVDVDDGVEHVVDLGADATDAHVEVVDGTAIVVRGDDQYDIALQDADAEAFMRNGVLTIRMEESA